MKKAIIIFVVLALVVGLFLVVGTYRWNPELFTAKFSEVKRKTIRQPINASGVIEPDSTYTIKSKASGEVKVIHVRDGEFVHKDQVLIELDPIDEQRTLDRAKSALVRAEAMYEQAKIALDQREKEQPIDVRLAQAQLDSALAGIESLKAQKASAQANLGQIQWVFGHTQELYGSGYEADQQLVQAKAQLESTEAQVQQLESEIVRAKAQAAVAKATLDKTNLGDLLTQNARQALKLAEADYATAKKNLDEAQQRYDETIIKAPVDGLVVKVTAHLGDKIQGGMESLTGGTVLLALADVRKLYVVAKVDEADIGNVRKIAPAEAVPQTVEAMGIKLPSTRAASKPGDGAGRVSITVDSFPDNTYEGVIERISPQGEQAATIVTYDVRIMITSEGRHELFLASQAKVDFTLETAENALVVENEAIQDEYGEVGVYVPAEKTADQKKEYKFVKVKTGITDGEFTVILDGLSEGQKVYTRLPQELGKKKEET